MGKRDRGGKGHSPADSRGLSRRAEEAIRKSARHARASDTDPSRRLAWSTLRRAMALAEIPVGHAALLLLLALALAALPVVSPRLEQWAIDDGIRGGEYRIIVAACLWLIALALFQLGAGAAQGIVANRLGQDAMDRLRRRVFAHMQRLSIGFYERREPGKIIARVTSDIDAINELLRMVLTGLI
ncbi:MAG: ABC transporter transmembrane domain-containing protein, partial [Acidobacteriota bacterium]|nr:ABC transporter transmembrane domain-containing protein [Acidobacteriota bacterium]